LVFSNPALKFGPFRWDPGNRLLLRDGAEVPLPPRVLALLECLVERPGQVISRQELTDRVWRDAFVTDTSLAEAISYLRQALGDDPQSPTYVQTLHRRGYRFIAPVEREGQLSVPRDAGSLPSTENATAAPSIGILVPWSLVVLLSATLVVALWKLTHPPVATQPRVVRFELASPDGTAFRANSNNLAVSPDGRTVAFVSCGTAQCRLFVRDINQTTARALDQTGDAASPFFSPDGRSIGFFADGKLKRISLSGGTPTVLADAPDPLGGTWLDDGRIVFAAHVTGGLDVIHENGGNPSALTRVDPGAGELGHRWPHWNSGNTFLTFTATTTPSDRRSDRAMALSLETNATQVVTGRATAPILLSGSVIAFARGSDLEAARFDAQRGVMAGAPVIVGQDLRLADDGRPIFAASAQGTLVHVGGGNAVPQLDLVQGSSRPLAANFARMSEESLDPDGRRLAGIISDGLRSDLWVGDLSRGTMTRITNSFSVASPVWRPDGKQLVFSGAPQGIYHLWTADPGSPSAVRLLTGARHQFASDVTADGQVVFTQIDPASSGDVWVRRADGRIEALVKTPFDERDGVMSPDGRWLAYRSDESGRWQVYVKSLNGGARTPVSDGGAGRPWWVEGNRLFYTAADNTLMGLSVTAQGPATPAPSLKPPGAVIAVSRSGAVLVVRPEAAPTRATVVLEAWQEIRRALPPAVGTLPR
jgi:serine/threonine-protein kinase